MDTPQGDIRKLDELINFAKLVKNDLLPTYQSLHFDASNTNKKTFRLLELNNELLKNIDDNNKLLIKGCDNDDLVICSETSTYNVTLAETSNNLLLIKPVNFFSDLENTCAENIQEVKVYEVFQSCLETNVGKSSLSRLIHLLDKTVYKGPEYESEVDEKYLFTFDELKNVIQVSDREITEALNFMDVIEIGGFMREIDFEYHFRVLSYMLKLIEENSWSLDTVDYIETCEALDNLIPEDIIKCLFEKYTIESKKVEGIQLYKYKEEDVCTFFARVILRTGGKFNLNEFLQAWNESVPEGMTPKEDMLYGVAVINRSTTPAVIWAFEENSLPDNINDRFQVLFDVKDKWTVPEISPYIRRLATQKLDVNALLAKHARASKVDGVKYYSAKHAK